MTGRELFDAAYLRVCNGLSVLPDREQADECYRVARDYPASLYDEAASRLIKDSRFLPKPAEWIATLSAIVREAHEQHRQEREAQHAAGRYRCPHCQDTGFERKHCTEGALCGPCAKRFHPYDHDYMTDCVCRPAKKMEDAA